jgi:uncharacterized integral membrane protein
MTMAWFWVLVGAVLVALLWTFGAQNGRPVDLSYFGWYVNGAPLWAVAVVPAVLGLLVGFLVTLPGRLRGMVAHRRLRGQLQERERTIGQLQGEVQARTDDLKRITGPALPAAPLPEADPVLPDAPPEVPDVSTRSRLA